MAGYSLWLSAQEMIFPLFDKRYRQTSVEGRWISVGHPISVERLIYRDPELAPHIHSFCLSVAGDAGDNPRPGIMLELEPGVSAGEEWPNRIAVQMRDGLAEIDPDVRSAVKEFPAAMLPAVTLYPMGTGPFAADAGRIKQRRITKATQ